MTHGRQRGQRLDRGSPLLGRRRRVVITVNQYHTAGRVVAQSDLLAVLPASFVDASVPAPVVVRPLPVDVGPLAVDMVWLARRDADPAHRWLRGLVERSARFSP